MKRLNVAHSYYCNDDNYYNMECRYEFGSWQEFLDADELRDMDLNLVFRWDMLQPEDPETWDVLPGEWRLHLYVMQQRKGRFVVVVISVRDEDEDGIAQWLRPRWDHLQKLWVPLSGGEA